MRFLMGNSGTRVVLIMTYMPMEALIFGKKNVECGAPGKASLGEAKGDGDRSRFPEPLEVPAWKRSLDLALVLLTLPITLPFLILFSAWVYLVSPGRLFFIQERVGRGGSRFRCFKLRTMHDGCATAPHQQYLQQLVKDDRPMVKLDTADPRLIPGARILRALGIDELPQLWNVVRGEMSVVGPRPCIPYEADQFALWQRERFRVLPGMTGLWQVRGKNRTTFTQMIRLDIDYVRNQSLWLDARILLGTPAAVLKQLFLALNARRQRSRQARNLREDAGAPIATAGESGVVG